MRHACVTSAVAGWTALRTLWAARTGTTTAAPTATAPTTASTTTFATRTTILPTVGSTRVAAHGVIRQQIATHQIVHAIGLRRIVARLSVTCVAGLGTATIARTIVTPGSTILARPAAPAVAVLAPLARTLFAIVTRRAVLA